MIENPRLSGALAMVGLLHLAPVLLLIPLGDDSPEMAEEKARHQGTWAVERSVRNGKEGPSEVIREIVRVVDGDRVVWKRGGNSFAATTFELDPSADPKAIDLIPEGGPNRGDRVLGIYSFEEDRLVICVADPGKPRPTAFASEPGDNLSLMTFRRADPNAPTEPEPPAP